MRKRTSRPAFLVGIICTLSLCEAAPAYQDEIQEAAQEIGDKLEASGVKTVAVVDFTDLSGNATELGRFLAEELSSALTNVEGLNVIDRTHLQSIIEENELASAAMIAPDTARRLGQITGVQALVTGTMTQFSDSIRITAKALDSATARIYASVSFNIPNTATLGELIPRSPARPETEAPKPRQAAASEPPPKYLQIKEIQGLLFQLQSCQVTGGGITCRWLLTNNNAEERYFSLTTRCGTELFDRGSNSYEPIHWEVGSVANDARSLKLVLVPNVPTPLLIQFTQTGVDFPKGQSKNPNGLMAIKIGFRNQRRAFENPTCYHVSFTDIPL